MKKQAFQLQEFPQIFKKINLAQNCQIYYENPNDYENLLEKVNRLIEEESKNFK